MNNEEELTAEQFRRRLYSLFEKRGVVDYLKTQMRHLLVEELQECVPGGNILKKRAAATASAAEDDNSLFLRAANSLVANHLQKCDYEYTMGIFIPESGTYPDKMFSTADLLRLLHINPSSELYKKLVSQFASYSKKGFLWQLLCELCSLFSSSTVNTSVQTDFMSQYSLSSLDEKLNGVERIYRSKKEKHHENAMLGLEEKLVSLQRQLEERYETELQLELTRMKENDLVKFRMEEKEKCRKELELSKRESEKNYQIRLNALRERERNFTERLQKEEEMQLKETYIQRQSLLEEISALRERDAGITRTLEGINREKSLHEEKMKSQEELVRQKLNEVNCMEIEYHQRLQNEINKFKIEEQKKWLDRSQDLDKRETQVKTAELRIADNQTQMQSLKEELQNKNAKVHELEKLLQEEHRNELTLVKNNDYLTAKLREMMDLNEKNAVSRREFESEKMQHSETMNLNECLRTRQEKFMKESLQLNQEIACVKLEMEKVRDELNHEKVLYDNYKKQLDERLQKEVIQNRKLLQQCEEQSREMKALNQEMSEVQYKLLMAQKALDNEITKKKKRICSRSLSSRRVRDEYSHRPSKKTHRANTRSICKCVCSDESCDEISSCRSHSFIPEICQGSGFTDGEMTNEESSNLIAEIKYEKKILEEQMKNIQHGYRCFQNRLMQGASPPARTSVTEAVPENTPRASKKKLQYVTRGERDSSPVPAQILSSGSKSLKTLASTPRKDSIHSAGKRGHSISALPRFDISQLTGEDENRSIDEGSPVAAIISELGKTREDKIKVDEARSQRTALPMNHSSAMLPTTTAAKVQEPSSLVASPPIPDFFQTVSAPSLVSAPPSSSVFAPISTPFPTSALPQISAPSVLSAYPSSSAHAQISAPVHISASPSSSALAPISAPHSTSAVDQISAPVSMSAFAPFPASPLPATSAIPSTSAPPAISASLPVSASSASSSSVSISIPLSVSAPPPASTTPPVSVHPPLSQLSSLAPSYSSEKSLHESLAVEAINPPFLQQDSLPVNTQAIQPLPVFSLDDAWGCAKKSEPSSHQSKSSNAEVSEQHKSIREEISEKAYPEQNDSYSSEFASSHSIPGLGLSDKKEKEIQNPVLDKDDSSQIETEIESDILPDSGSARSSPVLNLAPEKKTDTEKPPSTEDKPELLKSESDEIHSESLSQSHMSDSEVDDLFENW